MKLALNPPFIHQAPGGLQRRILMWGILLTLLIPGRSHAQVQTADITFCVDLACLQSVTAPSVFGTFNGWNAGANPITDPDGDNIYCATVAMPVGDQEYLFFTQEEDRENMTPGDPCTVTNFGFTNRVITVVAGVAQTVTFGWETCDPTCGTPPVTTDITLCVDLACQQSVTAPSVLGTFNGWNAAANPITDPDGDGVFCATVALLPGDQEYKFFTQEQGQEDLTPGDPCTVTNFGFTNRVITVVEGVTQTATFGWEVCDPTCGTPPTTTDITLCVDLSCFNSVTAPSVLGTFNGWNAAANPVSDPDGDGVFCATVALLAGDQEYKFFFQEEGQEDLTPGDPCTVTNFGFTNRVITVVQGVAQTATFGWEVCDPNCIPPLPPPDLPITFEDQANIDYNLVDFAGACSTIGTDPVDPSNIAVSVIKKTNAAVFAGTVVGDAGLANPIAFSADQQKMSVRVWAPAAGIPVLLKVENSANGGIASEALAATTQAMMWETLVFDFSMGTPPLNLANVYDKVVIFFNFGNVGANQTYYFDDIMLCPAPTVALTCPPTIMAEGCSSADVAPYANLMAFMAAGGMAVDADSSSFTLLNETTSGSCPLTVMRTYQVSDFCGNTATCTQEVLISDTTPPTIICPSDMTVACPTDIVVDINLAEISDRCDASPVVTASGPTLVSGIDGCEGATYEVMYSVVDACGNGPVSCTQTWTLENEAPILTCPAPMTVACGEDIVVDESDVTVVTSCGVSFTTVVSGPNVYDAEPNCPGARYVYGYLVTDACGRLSICTREFLIDNAPPEVVCLPGQTVSCAEDIITDESQVNITTSCGDPVELSISDPVISNGENCPGTYTYTYTIEDRCGRTASCTQTWTIANDGPLIVECAPDRVVECSDDVMADPEALVVEVSCELEFTTTAGPIVALDDLGDCPGALYEITYTVEDACGRTTECTQTFTVENRAPRVFPDEDQIVACREDINPRWENCFVETDCNLGIVRFEIIGPIEDELEADCNGKIINYLYSVWDACGRMTCVAQAWTIRNDGPTFDNAPADVTVDCFDVPDGLDVTASFDGCGDIPIAIGDLQMALDSNNFLLTRTFTADDGCGNTITHEQAITVTCDVASNKTFCTAGEEFWGNDDQETLGGMSAMKLLVSFRLSETPLVLGLPQRSLEISYSSCVATLLPSVGNTASAFPEDLGDASVGPDCTSEGLETGAKGQLQNGLAGQVLILMLNERMDPYLGLVPLSEMCLDELPESVLLALPDQPTIGDLRELGNEALGGLYPGNLKELREALQLVNAYFEGCLYLDCDGGTHIPGKLETVSLSVAGDNIQLRPNPASTETVLNYRMEGERLQLEVFSLTGQMMYSRTLAGGDFVQSERLDMAAWPEGVYLIRISNGVESRLEKLIKL